MPEYFQQPIVNNIIFLTSFSYCSLLVQETQPVVLYVCQILYNPAERAN